MTTFEGVTAADVNWRHIGRITDRGLMVMAILCQPIHAGGVSLALEHPETGFPSLLDLEPGETLWLAAEDAAQPPPGWMDAALTVADRVIAQDACQR
jgi:hypothetical protein